MMVVGRTWQTVVSCVCVRRGGCVRFFFVFSAIIFFRWGGGWMDVDGCHVAYRCRVAVCCVVLCRKEGGGYDVCTVRINQLSERE